MLPRALAAALPFLAWTETAHAVPRRSEVPARARPIVELFVASGDRGFASLLSALETPRFAGFELRWERLERFIPTLPFDAGSPEASAHCFVELSHRARAKLYCSDRNTARFVIETVPSGVPGTTNETAALARTLGAMLDALASQDPSTLTREKAQARVASEPPEAPEPPEPDEPALAAPAPAPAPRPFPLRPGAFYRVAAHSSQIPVTHGPGLELGLVDFGSRRRGTFLVSAAYELPASYEDRGFDLALSSLALRAGVETSGKISGGGIGGSSLGGRLTLGLDVTRLSPRENGGAEGYEPHPGTRSKSFVISAAVFFSLRLAAERSFFASVSADIDPVAVHYDIAPGHPTPAGRTNVDTVIERFRVRPGLSVGLRLW